MLSAQLPLDCDTSPSVPGLSLRTPPASLDAPVWCAPAPDVADCVVDAVCPPAWTTLPPWSGLPHEPHSGFGSGLPQDPQPDSDPRGATIIAPPASCPICCVVEAMLPALDSAPLSFDCSTEPPPPELPRRTPPASLLGYDCWASAFEPASWVVSAF